MNNETPRKSNYKQYMDFMNELVVTGVGAPRSFPAIRSKLWAIIRSKQDPDE